MNVPTELRYTEEHEWIRIEGDNIAYIGVTDFAQGELGDIVYVEIETEGEELEQNAVFGTVEAVKTVSDLYLPVAGKIEKLANEPEIVNSDPYGDGWMVKIELKDPSELEGLLSPESYNDFINA
jgi:glycine cleavage system H protein